MDKLISKLKELELEEIKLKNCRNKLLQRIKEVDKQLDQISTKRSLSIKELEMVYLSDQNQSESSDIEFQSLCSENSLYPKSSDLDSDEYTQKRKDRSDSTASDVEIKKVKTRSGGNDNISHRLSSVDEVNLLDQQMLNQCFDDVANNAINDINESDPQFKELSSDPLFESLVKDVENNNIMVRKSSNSSLCRSHSTDGNFKENVPPSSRVRRTASNRFRFDQQTINTYSADRKASNYKSNSNVISQPTLVPYQLLRGKTGLLSNLLSENETIDEKNEKSFSEDVEIVSKDFKQNFSFWEKKTTECLLENKRNSKSVSV